MYLGQLVSAFYIILILSLNVLLYRSPRQVAHFVSTLPGVRMLNGDEIFHRLIEEEVDGEAFLLLSQTDLVKMLGLKLGPAIKVFNAILLIQAGSKNNNNINNNGSVRDNAG